MTSSQKSYAICVLTAKSQYFARKLTKYLTSKWILPISWISTAKYCFPRQSEVEKWKFDKIWKSWNPKRRAACDVIYLTIVAMENQLGHHVVLLNWKYKWRLLYVPNFKLTGWIVSRVEGGGGGMGPIDPPPLKASCSYFFLEGF